MHIVHVFIEVKAEYLDDFIKATIENAQASLLEPGIARFDFLKDIDNPNRFILVEVYRTIDDPTRHKQTAHYKRWKEVVEPMMAGPRTRMVLENVIPGDEGWG
jgi:quinol monooxygenase YgiN